MREVEILKKKQLKCYLYTRVSTSMQVDGYSLDAQYDVPSPGLLEREPRVGT